MPSQIQAFARFLAETRKAVAAGAGAAVAVLGPRIAAGQTPSQTDYALAIGFAVLAFVGVYFTPNQSKAPATPPSA